MRPRRVGDLAWLLEAPDPATARGLAAAVTVQAPAGFVGARLGARTVLVEFGSPLLARQAAGLLARLDADPVEHDDGSLVGLDVVYDGADLAEVAGELGCSVDALISQHTAATWTADFCGFAPGFAYLSGWSHTVARRSEPRTRVPVGSVGLAGHFSAVYPSASPGGWRLLGHTRAVLWDPARDRPALVGPGDRVWFRAVREHLDLGPRAQVEPEPSAPGLVVLDPGPLTLVQDLGRGGLEHLGVPPSGAADAGAARRANRQVGNPRDDAVLESLGGLVLEAVGDQVLSVVGAEVVGVQVYRAEAGGEEGGGAGPAPSPAPSDPDHSVVLLPDGAHLQVGPARGRCYVAVRGGVAVAPVLGSRSTDALSGLGPAPLRAGSAVPVGRPTGVVAAPEPLPEHPAGPVRVVLGPRTSWFTPQAVDRFLGSVWTVGEDSNRVGLRLSGPVLARSREGELASEPMVAGAVQVPPSGQPVVLLRDHPVTGGYPVIGVVVSGDLDRLGRLSPGDPLRFAVADD